MTASPTRTTLTSPTATASAEPSETPDVLESVCRDNPDPATDDVNQVDIPNAGDVVASPVTVQGRVDAFEANFRITIFDAAGNTIVHETAIAYEGQSPAPVHKTIAISGARAT